MTGREGGVGRDREPLKVVKYIHQCTKKQRPAAKFKKTGEETHSEELDKFNSV